MPTFYYMDKNIGEMKKNPVRKDNDLYNTVFVIDDDKEVLNAITWLLESVNINAECYESPVEFCNKFDPKRCGCIVTDVRMPIMSGIQLFEYLFQLDNKIPIIFLTGHGDIPMAVQMIKAGAVDFISKPFNDQHLIEQIQKAIATNRKQRLDCEENKTFDINKLSKREQQVIELVVSGKLNKQIAKELNISNSTVEFHRSRAMKKMGARNTASLVKIFLKK